MGRKLMTLPALLMLLISFAPSFALAGSPATEPDSESPVQTATFQARCQNVPDGWPDCADSPPECGAPADKCGRRPFNCLYLEEPIGGRPGYDMFVKTCAPNPKAGSEGDTCAKFDTICTYEPWFGNALGPNEFGPVQAVLAFEKDQPTEGPFGLVYNYLGLVYNYMSGIIISVVILWIIIGGIRISMAQGNTTASENGRKMIITALIGMIMWFTASVILYTINPTFFVF